MIRGIGIDMIELHRIQANMEKKPRFINRILTEKEKIRLDSLKNERRRIEYLAGRFAAKEACGKALGSGIGKLSFQHIEVLNDEKGAPQMVVKGYENMTFFLSISHTKEHAIAQVIVQ
jgi:holo-[acyl-carrier protein] synthase